MHEIKIGRLLSSSTTQFVVGCRVHQLQDPGFGSLVRVNLEQDYQAFGLIYDVVIKGDELIRQLVTSQDMDSSIIADNRENRIVPVEMSVLTIGYRYAGEIRHLLPPRPALSLDMIYLCDDVELIEFSSGGRFGYFRHILRAENIPTGELLAAHIVDVYAKSGNAQWVLKATKEIITLLRDDYEQLMAVLGALSDAIPNLELGAAK